jgi:hypothetical protein
VTAYRPRLAGGAAGLLALVLLVAAAPVAGAIPLPASGAVPAGRVVAGTATPPAPEAMRPVPKRSGDGRRIVYSERTPQHAWLVDARGRVVRDFPVSGRKDWPRPGTYRVFSKSPRSYSTTYGVSFRWMVRFAHGHSASIGFHTIPRYRSGRLMHPLSKLGKPVGRGGCPHSADPDARFLYRWAGIGATVVVVR